MPQLLIQNEASEISTLFIGEDPVTIGRRRGNKLCLPHLSVSGYHATIEHYRGCMVIKDLSSTNGTLVNGERIRRHILVHLDEIVIGSYQISYSETYNPHESAPEAVEKPVAVPAVRRETITRSVMPIIDPMLRPERDDIAVVKVNSGNKAGSVVMLEKPVTTIGKTSGGLGAISKKSTGYYFVPVDDRGVKHNGRSIETNVEVKLVAGDLLEIDGEYLEFIHPYYST